MPVGSLLELLFRAFGRWPAFELDVPPLEHLRWKIRSGPTAQRHQWVAERNEKILRYLVFKVSEGR